MATGDGTSVTGGSQSAQADYRDMRTFADRLDASGDDAGRLGRAVVAIGASMPAKSAVLSPGSALRIVQEVTTLSAGLVTLQLRMEFTARALRLSVVAYEITDAWAAQAMAGLNFVTAPFRLLSDAVESGLKAGVESHLFGTDENGAPTIDPDQFGSFASNFGRRMDRHAYEDPDVVDGFLNDLSWALPGDLEGQVGLALDLGRRSGLLAGADKVTVSERGRRTSKVKNVQIQQLITSAANVERASTRDHSTMQVQRTVGPDGKGVWTVVIPGTSTWERGDHHGAPTDTDTNLAAMVDQANALQPAVLAALAASMRAAHVRPGSEAVMFVGHSQGGLVAAQMAADPSIRAKYNVREVVAAGAPISRIPIPKSVNVLSIENVHDPIPRLDLKDEPDAINRTTARLDPQVDAAHRTASASHDKDGYARDTKALDSTNPDRQVQDWYHRTAKWQDGTVQTYTYRLRRQ